MHGSCSTFTFSALAKAHSTCSYYHHHLKKRKSDSLLGIWSHQVGAQCSLWFHQNQYQHKDHPSWARIRKLMIPGNYLPDWQNSNDPQTNLHRFLATMSYYCRLTWSHNSQPFKQNWKFVGPCGLTQVTEHWHFDTQANDKWGWLSQVVHTRVRCCTTACYAIFLDS